MNNDVYRKVYVDCRYKDEITDYSNHHLTKTIYIRHDELMAIISGGIEARKAWVESHSTLLYDEILYVDISYDLSREYDKYGNLLDDHSSNNSYDLSRENNKYGYTLDNHSSNNVSSQQSSTSSNKGTTSQPKRVSNTSNNSSLSQTSSNSMLDSSDSEEIVQIIGGIIMLIISICIFIFYAKAKFGFFLGILYSLFFYVTVPVHYFFF